MNEQNKDKLLSLDISQSYQEPIQTPGYIQPHGVLIIVEKNDFNISYLSNNTEQFLQVSASSLIGTSLHKLFSVQAIKKIQKYLNNNYYFNGNHFHLKIKLFQRIFQVSIHQIQEKLIIELEPQELINHQEINIFDLIRQSIYQFKKADNLGDLSHYLAENIKKITQFDRVMVYQFTHENNGIVIGEAKEDYLESYLDLHYPEFDIPAIARQLYVENWLRIIPNVNYQPVAIFPNAEILDLSHTYLRSVSSCHLTYLKNMGVAASMSISILDENKLWGLIACHNYTPKYINYQTRKVGEFLGQFMSLQIKVLQEKFLHQYRDKIAHIQAKIRQNIAKKPAFINDIIKNNDSNLIDLLNAQGIALVLGKQVCLHGTTPTESQVKNLIKKLLTPEKKEVFYTDCLAKFDSEAEEFKIVASGMLAISIFLTTTSYHLIWFRPEQIQTVTWAGNPEPIFAQKNDSNIPILCPRNSFESWKETVKNKSLPWQNVEIQATLELRNIILLAALEFSHLSQNLLEESAKQAQKASLAKSQFLAKMSHELRTPLNAILGFSQIMSRDHSLSGQQHDYLSIINRSGEYLLTLINDVLEMSKIEAGQLKLNETSFDFWYLIKSIQDMFLIKATNKGLTLVLQQSENLPRFLIGDEGKIRQIIINLVGNAIKFTDTGQVILRLSQLTSINDKILLKIEVEDTGKGIDTDEITTIFEPFKQAENTYNSEQGTGLGLSISQQFAHLMDGEITVTSVLNQGSIFTSILPLKVANQVSLTTEKNTQKVIHLASESPIYRILIVEDVPENQQLMVDLLQSVGFEVNSAFDGFEAIDLWQSWQPDLIFMDMRMPNLDGYEATRRIRQISKNNQKVELVPIIALTAIAFDEEKRAILAVGYNDVIYKPFREEVLFEIINKYLRVKYIYEAEPENTAQADILDLKNIKNQLFLMPNEWQEKLKEAAFSAREKHILTLIKSIPQQYFALAKLLREMLENLAFNEIVSLMENRNNE